jgi:hypothetical protein
VSPTKVTRFTVSPAAAGRMGCHICGARFRAGEKAVSFVDSLGVDHAHDGACPTYTKPLPDPSEPWFIQGSDTDQRSKS